jgi:SAM-dependent methyltransferase
VKRLALILPAVGVSEEGLAAVRRDLAAAEFALRERGFLLEVVPLPSGSTLGQAFLAGFRAVVEAGTADVVATMDATGQHDASELPRLVDLLDEFDVVIGSRWARDSRTPGLTVRRWLLGRLANAVFRVVTGVRGVSDATSAFRVTRLDVLRRLDFDSFPDDARGIQLAFVAGCVGLGLRVGEAPILYLKPTGKVPRLTVGDVTSFLGSLHLVPRKPLDFEESFGAAGDLERLGTADRFFGWTIDHFKPYLKGRVLEVGAGLGTITRKLVALEPALNLFDQLRAYASVTPQVTASSLTCEEFLGSGDAGRFDVVLYLNVLEHIEHDVAELRTAAAGLVPGGHVLVFGPAMGWLYSDLDFNAGHYRRYTVASLRRAAVEAGLEIAHIKYLDILGVLPYWLVYRVMRRQTISGSSMWAYDKVLVPLSRFLQWMLPRPPLGKNVIMIARTTSRLVRATLLPPDAPGVACSNTPSFPYSCLRGRRLAPMGKIPS